MNFVPYAVPLFILALLVEFVYARVTGRHEYRLNDTVSSLAMGTLSRLRGLLQVGIAATAADALWSGSGLQLSTSSPLAWIVCFVAYDLCYYFSHRYGHEWRILWAAHVAHHQSEEFNLSTALRQTSTGLLNTVFYIPLYLAGFPAEMIISVGSLNLIYQFWVHTEHVRKLGVWDRILVTPSNHRVHHAKNPCYIDRNYGGVFILWDRLFGTFAEERDDEPCTYGITRQLNSWNPLWANLHSYAETWRDASAAPRWQDKLTIWFKSPGWYPQGVEPYAGSWTDAKFDPPATTSAKAYALAQFAAHVPATFLLIGTSLPMQEQLAGAALLCLGFFTQGAILEGRANAQNWEVIRALAVAGFGAWLGAWWIATYAVITLGASAVWLRTGPAGDRRQSPD